jgi:hypothetical protein
MIAQLCTFSPNIVSQPRCRPASAPSVKAPGFDDVVMRLQRGKLERERQKHMAEHAFDYTAPPAPRNIQAIAQLALPASSRVLSAKKKAASTSVQQTSRESHRTGGSFRGTPRNFDGIQSHAARPAAAVQPSTYHHMSPAVAAALVKYQRSQSANQEGQNSSTHSSLELLQPVGAAQPVRNFQADDFPQCHRPDFVAQLQSLGPARPDLKAKEVRHHVWPFKLRKRAFKKCITGPDVPFFHEYGI